MKCEEGGDLGGGRGDSEVRWVIVYGTPTVAKIGGCFVGLL